jgi:hypothetical protein
MENALKRFDGRTFTAVSSEKLEAMAALIEFAAKGLEDLQNAAIRA